MNKIFTILVILFATLQLATAQPTGPEVTWVCNVGSSSDAKFTQDDKYIVAIDGGDIIIIDASNGQILRRNTVSPGFARRQVKLSKDDSLIYSCGDDGIIYINRFSDLQKSGEITRFRDTSGGHYGIEYFDIDINNSIIAISNGNKELIIYNYQKDSILYFSQGACNHINYFDNYQKLAVARSGQVQIYNMSTFKLIATTYSHTQGNYWVTNFDISPDNTKIVDCGNDGKIYIRDVQTGQLLEDVPYVTDGSIIWAVKYYKNGTNIIMGGDGKFGTAKLSIYDYINKKIFYKNNGKESTLELEISNTTNKFLICGMGEDYYHYCLIDGNLITSVISSIQGKDIIIYPNPVDSNIIIDLENNKINEKINFVISDLQGKLINSGKISSINNKIQIDVSQLQNGIYFLTLTIDNNFTTYKFIKGR